MSHRMIGVTGGGGGMTKAKTEAYRPGWKDYERQLRVAKDALERIAGMGDVEADEASGIATRALTEIRRGEA